MRKQTNIFEFPRLYENVTQKSESVNKIGNKPKMKIDRTLLDNHL